MDIQRIDVKAESTASAAEIYALLADGATWPVWGGFTSYEPHQAGEDGAENGVGAVRTFHTRRRFQTVHSRERIVELVPDRRLSYVLVSGIPIHDYRASVDLLPTARGTVVHWHSTFTPKIPGTGRFIQRTLEKVIGGAASALGRYAETHSVR